MSSKSVRNPKKSSKKQPKSDKICLNRMAFGPKLDEKYTLSPEIDAEFGAISTEKVGLKVAEMASDEVSAPTKVARKCAHCGRIVLVDSDLADGLSEIDTVCKVCNTPDWSTECIICGQKPVHRATKMCVKCMADEDLDIEIGW